MAIFSTTTLKYFLKKKKYLPSLDELIENDIEFLNDN